MMHNVQMLVQADVRILQPTSLPHATPDPWALHSVRSFILAALLCGRLRMMREIIDVPLPLAASRRLINFLTFHISMFFSASLGCGALMTAVLRSEPGFYGLCRGQSLP